MQTAIGVMTDDSSAPRPTPPQHLGFVDSLRGIAFLAVFCFHITFDVTGLPRLLGDVLGRGFAGVQLFFVVSAFTLCASLESRGTTRVAIRDFFIRRVFRIAPMFWLAIGIYWLAAGLGDFWDIPGGVGPRQYVLALFLAHGLDPRALNGIVPGGWSVAVEIQFYLLLPFLFRLASSLPRALALLAIAVAISIGAQPIIEHLLAPAYAAADRPFIHDFAFYSLPAQLPVFCCGILAYRLLGPDRAILAAVGRRAHASSRLLTAVCLAAILALAFPLALTAQPLGLVRGVPGFLGYGALFAGLLGVMATSRIAILDNPVMRFIGKVSYSGYLLHFLVLFLIHNIPGVVDLAWPAGLALQFSLGLAVTLALATLAFASIETPGIALGRWLIRTLARRGASEEALSTPQPSSSAWSPGRP